MNMKELFDDFVKYVDAMDSNDIAKSISDAIEHSANSYILDGINENISYQSPVQKTDAMYHTGNSFMFCSSGFSFTTISYTITGMEKDAA